MLTDDPASATTLVEYLLACAVLLVTGIWSLARSIYYLLSVMLALACIVGWCCLLGSVVVRLVALL